MFIHSHSGVGVAGSSRGHAAAAVVLAVAAAVAVAHRRRPRRRLLRRLMLVLAAAAAAAPTCDYRLVEESKYSAFSLHGLSTAKSICMNDYFSSRTPT